MCRRTTQDWRDPPAPTGLLGNSVYPAGSFRGVPAPVERWAAEPRALFGRTHFMFLGGAVLPPHGRSLAEHGTRPLLHTDKPIISLQSVPRILCYMEGTWVGAQSIVFTYNCTCQKIAGARQLKGVYKKLMADINIDLQTKNGQKWWCNRSESCDLLQALWRVLILKTLILKDEELKAGCKLGLWKQRPEQPIGCNWEEGPWWW